MSKFDKILELAFSYGMFDDVEGIIIMNKDFGLHITQVSHDESLREKWKDHLHSEEDYIHMILVESVLSWVQVIQKDYNTLSVKSATDLMQLIDVYWKQTARKNKL